MTRVYVSHLASALGSRMQSVDEAEAAGQLVSPAAALREAGFDAHHVSPDDETSYDLAARAFVASGIDPGTVGAIVYSTCLPQNAHVGDSAEFAATGDIKHLLRFPASLLQKEFAMHDAGIVGLNQQACTGMLGALRIARALLVAEAELGPVLCITADRFPPGARYEQAYNLVSDGAAACVVSREPRGFCLRDVHQISNGAMLVASDDETAGSYFNYTCRLIEETLARNGLAMSDVSTVVPQNTNRSAWQVLCRLLDLAPCQVFTPPVATTGHVIGADNIINLAELLHAGRLSPGELVLTFMAGYGSNWQCALLEAV